MAGFRKTPFTSLRGAFSRRGNLELIELMNYEIASLRSQRQRKTYLNNLLEQCSTDDHVFCVSEMCNALNEKTPSWIRKGFLLQRAG